MYNPNEKIKVFAGVPFAFIEYKPTEKIKLEVSYFPVSTVNAKASYKVDENWTLFADYVWKEQKFYRSGREEKKDQMFYSEQKVGSGVSYSPNRGTTLMIKSGYSFDRYLYESKKYDRNHDSRIKVDGAYFIEAKASIAF